MTEPDQTPPAPKKPRKPKPPVAVRGKLGLEEFREFLQKCVAHRDLFNDAQIRFAQTTLQALQLDASGLIRVTVSPLASAPRAAKPRFTKREFHLTSAPGEDEVRTTTREIALLADEAAAFERIDSLPVEFLNRAAALFGFKAETLVGLKSAYAGVVADIRQMENIAASRPKSHGSQENQAPEGPSAAS
jgi:hypothetical protein